MFQFIFDGIPVQIMARDNGTLLASAVHNSEFYASSDIYGMDIDFVYISHMHFGCSLKIHDSETIILSYVVPCFEVSMNFIMKKNTCDLAKLIAEYRLFLSSLSLQGGQGGQEKVTIPAFQGNR